MSSESANNGIFASGLRVAAVRNLRVLKCPEEGGTKKEYEDFLDKIQNHVTIAWEFGKDTGHVVKTGELPDIEKPDDISDEDEESKWKLRLWMNAVDRYGSRTNALDDNLSALYALLMDWVSKMIRAKVKSKRGYINAEEDNDAVWLLGVLEDIMINFEEDKPKTLAIDDQMERIMRLKQGDTSNEDFLKMCQKELKIYEKHGGDFLWGTAQKEALVELIDEQKKQFKKENSRDMTDSEVDEARKLAKGVLKDEIVSMAVLKRADKKRYGNLQIGLKNSFLLGKNEYPTTPSNVLNLLNNYVPEWTGQCTPAVAGTGRSVTNGGGGVGNGRATAVSFLQASEAIAYLKGTNNSFFPNITCRLCGFKGHYQQQCPVATDTNGTAIPRKNKPGNGQSRGTGNGSGNSPGPWIIRDRGGGAAEGAGTAAATEEEVSAHISRGVLLNQHSDAHINPNWVLLDSESTDHIFCNDKFLTDIKSTTDGESLRMHTSGGTLDTHQKGRFGGFTVWYNPKCLANILSLALVSDQYRVTLDTVVENAFSVHISAEHVMKFIRVLPGLYLFDASNVDLSKLRNAFSFLNTVSTNKSLFRNRDVRKANDAITLNRRINHVAKDKFVRIVRDNWVRNNPITVGDVNRSHQIYGPSLPAIKGRTRYQESKRVKDTELVQLPKSMHEDLKNVTLCVDFHYVNGVTVFHSISRRVDYRTVTFPLSRSKPSIVQELKEVFKIYNARGFRIVEIHADNEFSKVGNDLLPVRMRLCGVDDHVPEIERSVQTQKNENRAVCHAMPYKCMPRIMVRELIKQGNEFLNAFGSKDSLADGLSPRNIIDNLPHVDYTDLKYEFGQYVQLHVTEKVTNTMKSRTIGAIVMGPRKIQGRYNFMSLETGAAIDGRVVAELPLTVDVIERVESLGRDQDQPFRASKMLKYEWRPGNAVAEDDAFLNIEDAEGVLEIAPEPVWQELPAIGPNPFQANLPPVVDEDNAPQGANENDDDHQSIHQEDENQGAPVIENQGAPIIENQGAPVIENQGAPVIENQGAQEPVAREPEVIVVEDVDEDEDSDDEEEPASRNEERERRSAHFGTPNEEEHGRGKRDRTKSSFSFLQTKFEDLDEKDKGEFFHEAWKEYLVSGKTNMLEKYSTGFIFAQMSARQGIKKYGREAELKLIAEFKQLIDYKTFHGRKASELSPEQKKKAANMINLIEEKVNRGHTADNPVIKARSCYNGKVQRGLYTKEETASPTVSTDGFFITSIIDAIEERDVAITDVKGAYLNANMIGEVLMKIIGKEIDLFLEIDPSLAEFVVYENGQRVLYVQLDKALYGCVQSALLWYDLYSSTLKDMGFVLNPYDLCVANATINEKQCTIVWYVDDNKISHVDPKVVDDIIAKIESKFGKMSQTRGTEHDFLGMTMKYKDKKVKIGMKKHILKAINSFSDDITRNAATPATSYLFKTRDSPKLDEERADNFHSVTAALIYVSRRSRLDIQTAVAFLCTRVAGPDEDDWLKLKRVLQYLRGTIDLVLTLGADDLLNMKSWVDVSYGIHDDCKSHTGGAVSWGWGVLLTKCQKQKLNTKSSTEGEIVGVSDFMPNMIWGRMFLEEQGFVLEKNTLFQDNQSAMKIITNGKRSSGQKTKHMDNRYFWIKDRLQSENIEVVYCPTEKMIADFFTKPLQGNLFRKFRDVVLGYKHISSLNDDDNTEESSSQERVGKGILRENAGSLDNGPSVVTSNKGVTWADVVKR